MSGNNDKAPLEKALDLFVYAPVGVALYLRDTVPMFVKVFVSRGRTEVDQRRRGASDRVSQAKAMGQFAVGYGGPKVKEKVEQGLGAARRGAESVILGFGAAPEAPGPPADAPARRHQRNNAPPSLSWEAERHGGVAPAQGSARREPSASTLVIPDYDELSASQVVERLEGLHPEELEAVRAYEEAHRARRTILFKVEQLTS